MRLRIWILVAVIVGCAVFLRVAGADASSDLKEATPLFIEKLTAALKGPDIAVKMNAVKALGDVGVWEAVDPLIGALKDPDKNMRAECVKSLCMICSPDRVEEYVRPYLTYRDLSVQAAGVKRLSETEEARTRAVDAVIGALNDDAIGVRMAAARCLAEFDVSPELEHRRLLQLALNESETLRRERALASIQEVNKAVGEAAERIEKTRRVRESRLKKALMDAFENRRIEIVAAAYEFFIRRGRKGSETLIIEAFEAHGDKDMAFILLNCGNDQLHKTAASWAKQHGYSVVKSRSGSAKLAIWGSSQR